MRSASSIFMLVLKPFRVYRKSSPYAVVKKEWEIKGVQRQYPNASTAAAVVGEKGTSWDEATLISEEIESLALAVLELCLSEGISK